jgi:rubrerythrin
MPRRNNIEKHQPFIFNGSCQNKRRYKTEQEARKMADLQILEKMNLELSVYKCDICGFWHLTRKSPKSLY